MSLNSPKILTILLSLIIINIGNAQYNLNAKISTDSLVKVGKLSNGLTYYIRKNSKPEKKVELRLVINAGSVLEKDNQQGLAHFMEHMNFNGLKHFPKNDLESYLQTIGVQFGADLNASTSFDETIYILPIPSDKQSKVDSGFMILSDWAHNALLDTAEISKERGVVIEESRLDKNATSRMMKVFFPKLLNGSLYASRMPIGKDSIISNFKPNALKDFYTTWYRPNLMAVIVVGDIEPKQAEAEIIKFFGNLKNPEKETKRPTIIPINKRVKDEAIVVTDKEFPYTLVQIINYIEKQKEIKTWGDLRNSIIEDLFNQMLNQRLQELTKLANPPFLFSNAGFDQLIRGYRTFGFVAVLGDKSVKEGIDALISTTESVKKFGFLPSELERAKKNYLKSLEQVYNNKDKTESSNYVTNLINNFLSGDPIPGITNRYKFALQQMDSIIINDVNILGEKMQTSEGKFTILMASEKSKSKLPSNEALIKLVEEASKMPVKAYEEKILSSSLMDKKPIAGRIIKSTKNEIIGTIDYDLSNGISVTLKPTNFKDDEILMDAWRLGGYHNYGLSDKENAKNAALLINQMGVKDLSPSDLKKVLSGKSLSVMPYINPYEDGIQGSTSKKDIETFFQLINLYYTKPRKDDNLFKSFISRNKSIYKNVKENPNYFYLDTLEKIQYGNNPWANSIPNASDFDKISMDRSFAIYNELFENAYGTHFTFTGSIDTNTIKPLIESYIGSLPTKTIDNMFTDEGLRPIKTGTSAIIKKGKEKQSIVTISFTGEIKYDEAEIIELNMLSEILNIKIIEKLREQMGGIYGGGSSVIIMKRPYEHYNFSIGFPCAPENVAKLSDALINLIKDIQLYGSEQIDLDKVKETIKKKNLEEMKTNSYWLDMLSQAWINKTDVSSLINKLNLVEKVTSQNIKVVANKYLNVNQYLKVVLMPEVD